MSFSSQFGLSLGNFSVRAQVFLVVTLVLLAVFPGFAQFTVTGVTDKATPSDTVTFSIGEQPGYTYGAFLNRERIPTGVPITLTRADYYELMVYATNVANATVTNRLTRFIVQASERLGTELGIPVHTPSPVVPSTAGEWQSARLRLLHPAAIPTGFEIPVVAWAIDSADHAVRGNGLLSAAGQSGIVIKRGVGSGFLAATNPIGTFNYTASLPGLSTNRAIQIEAVPNWTTVGGVLNGATSWPDGARIRITSHLAIPAGASLTIGAGVIVLVNPGLNITNDSTIIINGTVENPTVFMPVSRSQPWGGFFMRNSAASVTATGTIFTGSGADPTGGLGHRREQCLFLIDQSPRLSLTDSAAIYLAGQFGHASAGGTFNFKRFLLQRATTGGEYTGASFTVNDSAFIEFPDDSANFVDGDNDALYFVSGSHWFTNTLIGWTKDDGIDSGGSGYGPLTYQSCWFESTFHEGNSLSGFKNVNSRDSVYIDCGQGIENGYDGPTNRMDHCLFLGNRIGVRHGDNYPSIGNYDGRETVVNSLSLFNDRDVLGFNWHSGANSGWTNATGQMTIVGNWLSAPNEYFPTNSIWNPAADAFRLAPFISTSPSAAVGVGLALRTNQLALSSLAQGVPVRLSIFSTNSVRVNYAFRPGGGGAETGAGTLTFAPGETVKRIYPAGFDVTSQPSWDVVLKDGVGAEITGLASAAYAGTISPPQVSLAVASAQLPGYRVAEGTFVRLNGATAQPVSVTYTVFGDGAVLGSGSLTFNPPETSRRLVLDGINPFGYGALQIVLSQPVGGTLGGVTSVTYSNPVVAVAFGTGSAQVDLATIATGLPVGLNSPAPGDVTVAFSVDSPAGSLTNGSITLPQGQTSRLLLLPTIAPADFSFLRASLRQPVGAQLGGLSNLFLVKIVPPPTPTNQTLIPKGAVWKYRDAASAAPAGWNALTFDDSAWPSGPAQLGFSNGEEGDEKTLIADNDQITSYFRHPFTVSDPTAFAGLSFWLLRDDGGVVYLNGTEIFRSPNLPAPPAVITYSTVTVAPNGENTIDTGTTNRNALRAGDNELAVEIHQQSATSSDVSFDFELVGIGAVTVVPPHDFYVGRFDGRLTIAWGDTTFVLEQASELLTVNTVWTPVGSTSPVTLDASAPQRFYRLRKP